MSPGLNHSVMTDFMCESTLGVSTPLCRTYVRRILHPGQSAGTGSCSVRSSTLAVTFQHISAELQVHVVALCDARSTCVAGCQAIQMLAFLP